jgi:hypothetical protein
LGHEFGLLGSDADYREIDAPSARRLATWILRYDLAYESEIMTAELAEHLAEAFLDACADEAARYYTNGTFHEALGSASWNPVTKATFDTGVLVAGVVRAGCLWIEDED